jgi:hypothetical protein
LDFFSPHFSPVFQGSVNFYFFQWTSSVAHQPSCFEVGFLCVGLLEVGFFALPPFSGAKSEICQLAPCCQHVMTCSFVALFDFVCCSLAQEMSFVDHYLPYFRQRPAVSLSAFPAFVY